MALYQGQKHDRHEPQNVNELQKKFLKLQDKVALRITMAVGTMITALIFAAIALVALPNALRTGNPIIIVAWVSQAFLQLVLLPIIIVGQNLQNKHAEIRSEEEYRTTKSSYKDIEEILKHLDAQDDELLRQSSVLKKILQKIESKS